MMTSNIVHPFLCLVDIYFFSNMALHIFTQFLIKLFLLLNNFPCTGCGHIPKHFTFLDQWDRIEDQQYSHTATTI
jgi:hypothetical protein